MVNTSKLKMAASSSTISVLGLITKKHLQCLLCGNPFTEPKVLNCLHCFCFKCLRQLHRQREVQANKLTCPECGQQTILTATGVAELPTDFKLTALLKDIRKHEQKLRDLGNVPKCGIHTNKDLVNYCEQCNKLVCATCIAKTHRYHPLMDLPEALDNCKQRVAELAEKVDKNKTDLSVSRIETEKLLEELQTMMHDTVLQISTKADEEVARVREEEQKLKQEVQRLSKDRIQTYKTMHAAIVRETSAVDATLEKVKQLMAQGSCCEILEVVEEHFIDLQTYSEMQPSASFVDFEEGEKSLERLMLHHKPCMGAQANPDQAISSLGIRNLRATRKMCKLIATVVESGPGKTEFKIAFHVAAFPTHEIVVADINHKALTVLSSVNNGQYFPQRLPIKDLHNPRHVAVNKNGCLVVLDGHIIKVFDKLHDLVCWFKPGKGSNQGPWSDTGMFGDRRPTCLTVDENNQIAVGYSDEGEVSLHDSTGSLIRKLSAPMIGEYLTTYKQRLIYTNEQRKKLVAVDYKGSMVFSSNTSQPGWPCGLCCDKEGSIFVAVWKGQTSGEIQQYSPDGEYIGCVIKECGSAYDITLTPCGNLVVAVGKLVKIYQCD